MSIKLNDGIVVHAPKAIDARFVIGPGRVYTKRNLIPISELYVGLLVKDINDNNWWELVSIINDVPAWKPFCATGDSGILVLSILGYIDDTTDLTFSGLDFIDADFLLFINGIFIRQTNADGTIMYDDPIIDHTGIHTLIHFYFPIEPVDEVDLVRLYGASGGSGGGVSVHELLTGREQPNQHPISAISGLIVELNKKLDATYADADLYKGTAEAPTPPIALLPGTLKGAYYIALEDGDYTHFKPPTGGLTGVKAGENIVWNGLEWIVQQNLAGAVRFATMWSRGDVLPAPEVINSGQFLLAGENGTITIQGVDTKIYAGDWIVWNKPLPDEDGFWIVVRNLIQTIDGRLPDNDGDISIDYKEDKFEKGIPSGYTPLDRNAKILSKYLPGDVDNIAKNGVFFKADISLTHAPLPPADDSNNGHYYRVAEEGVYTLDGAPTTLYVNDLILSNGRTWFDIRHNVSTVSHKHPSPLDGNIYLNKDDIGLDKVDNTADIHKPVSNPTWTELFDRIKTDRIMPEEPSIHHMARLVAGLGTDGKLSMSVMPAAMLGAMEYKGSWNADTNDTDPGTPVVPLPPATPADKGYYYIISVAGSQVINIGEPALSFEIGDWVVSDGDRWDKINNTGSVTSVFGRRGDIFAEAGDYTIEKITNLERLLGDKLSDLNLNEPPIDTIDQDYILLEEYVSMVVYKGGINIGTVEPPDAEEGDYYIATEAGDYPNLDLLGVKVSDTIVYTSMIWQVQNRGDYYLADSDGDYKAFDPPVGGLEHVKSGDFIVWDGYMWAKQVTSSGSGSTFEIPLPTGLVVGNPVTYSGNAWKLANSSGSDETAHGIIMKTSSTTATVITAGEFKWKNHGFDVGNWYYLGTTGSYSKTRTTTGIEQLMLFVLTAEKVTAFVSAPVDTGTDAFSKTYFVNTIAERDLLPNINRKDRCIVLADTDSTMNGEWIVHDDTTDPPTWLPTGSSTGGAIIPEPTTEGSWLRRAKDKAAPGNPPALHYVWSEEIDCGTYN